MSSAGRPQGASPGAQHEAGPIIPPAGALSQLPPLRHWPRAALVSLVRFYRLFLSPWLGSQCRFEPTCSRYAIQALEQHGAAAGSYLTAARLLRCHPWCEGGWDAVPAARPRLFTHLFSSATVAGPSEGASQQQPAVPVTPDPLSSSRLSS